MEPRIFTRIAASRDAAIDHCLGVMDDKLADFSATQLPAGAIFPFSGLFGGPGNSHPVDPYTGTPNLGFALCDGGSYSAPGKPPLTTPDLRNRFVLCAGATYPIGAKGGAATVKPTVTVSATTLTAAQMPAHKHPFYGANTDGSVAAGSSMWLSTSAYFNLNSTYKRNAMTNAMDNTGGGGSHTHTATTTAAASLPPYYSLAYVMKL